jgi:hypothetical protein
MYIVRELNNDPKKFCNQCYHKKYCRDRNYQDESNKVRCLLGKEQSKDQFEMPINKEDIKYCNYSFNGLFTKALEHDLLTGSLKNSQDYITMKNSIKNNEQVSLSKIALAKGSTLKLVNPLASLSTVLVGPQQNTIKLQAPPSLSSTSGAAEIVELYSQAYLRDIPFYAYHDDITVKKILNSCHMNNVSILKTLPDYTPFGIPFTPQTIFRGITQGEKLGPYVSQFLLLDVPMGETSMKQQYNTLLPKPHQCEWGTSKNETILIQNGNLNSLPIPDKDPLKKYIYSGRSLAEAVHNDVVYQYFYQAGLILSGLLCPPNPGFPSYNNQTNFITGVGASSVLCCIAEVSALSLKHCWYWKWQVYRKLRPEVFGLWIDNVLTGTVKNNRNYDIKNIVFDNAILDDMFNLYGSFTLPLSYREGSPAHPAYPSGHACIAGACSTILKIYYNCNILWDKLPGVASGKLSGGITSAVEADPLYDNVALREYKGNDAKLLTVDGEINKLASNVAIGRNWAGIHYRTDAVQGMILGEEIAIRYMEDTLASCVENYLNGNPPTISFRKFDGSIAEIKPTLCKCNQ